MQKITPFLWFDDQAEEAAKFYVSIFENSRIVSIARYSEAGEQAAGRPKGSVMTVAFQLNGQDFTALNGGSHFKFTEAISLVVNCESQAEVDEFWEKLSRDGLEGRCGWLKDKYGLSWQVVPRVLVELLQDKDPAISERVMKAMLQMKKIDIESLWQAYSQKYRSCTWRTTSMASFYQSRSATRRPTCVWRAKLERSGATMARSSTGSALPTM